jgi:hypothetical protein
LLAQLRLPPGAPSARNILSHIERLQEIRSIGISVESGRKVHQNRLLRPAREGAQTAVFQLQQYEIERRHATLVAILVEATATLTNEILDLHDRMIGSFFTKARNKHEKTFAAAGKAINEKLRLYAKVGSALIDAKEKGCDPFSAIETVVPWEVFTTSVGEAEKLAREEDFDSIGLIVEHYHCCDRLLLTCLVAGKDVRGDYKSAWYSLGSVLRSSAAKKGGKFLRENDARKRFGGKYQSASVSGSVRKYS